MAARGSARLRAVWGLALALALASALAAAAPSDPAEADAQGSEETRRSHSADPPSPPEPSGAVADAGAVVGAGGAGADGARLRLELDLEQVPRTEAVVAVGFYRNAPTRPPPVAVAVVPAPPTRREDTFVRHYDAPERRHGVTARRRHRSRPAGARRQTRPSGYSGPSRSSRKRARQHAGKQMVRRQKGRPPAVAALGGSSVAGTSSTVEASEDNRRRMAGSGEESGERGVGGRADNARQGTEHVSAPPAVSPKKVHGPHLRNRGQDSTSSPLDSDSLSRSLEKTEADTKKTKSKHKEKEDKDNKGDKDDKGKKDTDKDKSKDKEKDKDSKTDKDKDTKADSKTDKTADAEDKFTGLEATPGDPAPESLEDVTKHRSWGLLEKERCGLSQADRIIGGEDASLGAYPWIVRVGYLGPNVKEPLYRCGGVLISKIYVVTAAHCVTNLPRSLKVAALRLGEHSTNTNPDCENKVCAEPVQDFKPASVIVHKEYGNPQFKNDIAIIRLEKEVTFNYYVMPICMLSGSLLNKNYVNKTSEVAGWGIYDIDVPKPATVLQTIKLNVVENDRCVESFQDHAQIGSTQMCVGGEVGHDSCGGDSGGPLMTVEPFDGIARYYLLGVVSFGAKRCGATTMPGVYTRVSSYMPWILENMHE